MKKIIAGIVDDQLDELTLLKQHLVNDIRFDVGLELDNARKLEGVLKQQPVDILFTDIHMPGLDGFAMLDKIDEPPKVVFVSSYPEYAIDSFDYEPLYFLPKPLEEERILRCLEKTAAHFSGNHDEEEYIFIRNNQIRALQKVYLRDIIYIESKAEYQHIHLINDTDVLTYKRLKDLIQELPEPCFFQIHRSFAINLHHLHRVGRDEVTLTNDIHLPVSRSKRSDFEKAVEVFRTKYA